MHVHVRHFADQRTLVIEATRGETAEVPTGQRIRLPEATTLLGALLAQAYLDGMTGLRLTAEPASATTALLYYKHSTGNTCASWNMTPPPPEYYGPLVGAILALAEIGPGIALEGTLAAEINGSALDVRVTMHTCCDVELSWATPEDRQDSDGAQHTRS